MAARKDDVRRALVNAKMPVPTCAVMAALQQNPDVDAWDIVDILRHRNPFIKAQHIICFLCRRGMAAIDWMPHTRRCKLKAKSAGPAALPKTAGIRVLWPLTGGGILRQPDLPDRTPSPPWTPRRHQEMAGPRCADVPLPRWFSLIIL